MATTGTKPVLTILRKAGNPCAASPSGELYTWGRVDRLTDLEKTACARCHEVVFAGWLNIHTSNLYCESCIIDVQSVAADLQRLEERIEALKLSEQRAHAEIDRLRNSEQVLCGVFDNLESPDRRKEEGWKG